MHCQYQGFGREDNSSAGIHNSHKSIYNANIYYPGQTGSNIHNNIYYLGQTGTGPVGTTVGFNSSSIHDQNGRIYDDYGC